MCHMAAELARLPAPEGVIDVGRHPAVPVACDRCGVAVGVVVNWREEDYTCDWAAGPVAWLSRPGFVDVNSNRRHISGDLCLNCSDGAALWRPITATLPGPAHWITTENFTHTFHSASDVMELRCRASHHAHDDVHHLGWTYIGFNAAGQDGARKRTVTFVAGNGVNVVGDTFLYRISESHCHIGCRADGAPDGATVEPYTLAPEFSPAWEVP